LPGTLSMPDGAISGAIVLVHGSGPHDRDQTLGPNKPFRDLAWGLAERGVAVLRYEKRTRQHAGKLAGNKNLTVQDAVIDDVLAGAALLRKHDRIDPKRVFVLGHSLGGMLAPRIGAADPSLAGLIIMAGIAGWVLRR
jgi:dienelactone hydrolase